MKSVKKPDDSGSFADWFHGIITRIQSEELLMQTSVGHFLIRVGESRFGYTLSFRVVDRCRHYMIDLLPNGKFHVVGETKAHRNLHQLVKYYQKVSQEMRS
ncbi:hypothetical protein CAPTEDRAFT_125580 [Capitella teleta]|uniref:SH2 domain-containing protein n=1 Tax=Capitella teleta TaxID=283909 RepID=R7UWU0_CAPTE|nr:hypothetical protein CAPTEDRAFT_102859 [Capitella teleta]ELU07876.1 hypothetical protein CAPTEDRAFT_125580 [Capitella teleta]|eukprot:ELT98302.1 hypothetical protein CAPTEDRAFT_102859 [Capitella teleta]